MDRERIKSEMIFWHEPAKLVMWLSLAVFVVAMTYQLSRLAQDARHSFKAQATQAESTTGHIDEATRRWEKRIDQILKKGKSIVTRVDNTAAKFEVEAPALVSALRADINALSAEGTGLIADIRLANPSTSAKNLVDDVRPHLVAATQQFEAGMTAVADAARVLDESLKDPKVKEFVDDAMAHLKSIFVNIDTASGNVILATADAKQVTTHLIGISDNFEGMTADSRLKLHQVLFPAPVKGFWPRTGQILSYIYKPILEGAGVYYRLQSLPVRIVEPIPLLK